MSKKIVINKCYGGFGLSLKAQKRYLELIGKEAFFYKQTKFKRRDGVTEYKKISSDEEESLCNTVTKYLGDTIKYIPNKYYWYDGDIKRDDPSLVCVVEELGEKANGIFAKLKIVEIPNNIEWEIDEYDGIEWVEESKDIWS